MKIAALAAVSAITLAACAAEEAEAADFSVLGQTVSIGATADVNYETGVEDWSMEFVPSAGWKAWGTDFKISSTFDVLELNTSDEIFEGLDFEAGYELWEGVRAYGEVSTDSDFEFGNTTVGVSFSF